MEKKTAQKTAQISGTNLFTLLLVLFVAFKLAGVGAVAQWSWFWVLSPIWVPLAAAAVIVIGAFLIGLVVSIYDAYQEWKWARRIRKAQEAARKATVAAVDAAMAAERKLCHGEVEVEVE